MTDQSLSLDWTRETPDRATLWKQFFDEVKPRQVAEIGVFRGAFAQMMLDSCSTIDRYYLIDPWRHLDDWDKPANADDDLFEQFYAEAMARTEAHAGKRVPLRGKTTEVIDQIPDGSLDLAYVDGDHTLRGITVDLVRAWPKVVAGGYLCGDDFTRSMWQHRDEFEPTLVFPFAVYFAEAVGAPIYALPHNQYVIHKVDAEHRFVDLTGRYDKTTVRAAMRGRRRARNRSAEPSAVEADGTAKQRGRARRRPRRLPPID